MPKKTVTEKKFPHTTQVLLQAIASEYDNLFDRLQSVEPLVFLRRWSVGSAYELTALSADRFNELAYVSDVEFLEIALSMSLQGCSLDQLP
jgi:hypothetical protein